MIDVADRWRRDDAADSPSAPTTTLPASEAVADATSTATTATTARAEPTVTPVQPTPTVEPVAATVGQWVVVGRGHQQPPCHRRVGRTAQDCGPEVSVALHNTHAVGSQHPAASRPRIPRRPSAPHLRPLLHHRLCPSSSRTGSPDHSWFRMTAISRSMRTVSWHCSMTRQVSSMRWSRGFQTWIRSLRASPRRSNATRASRCKRPRILQSRFGS